MPDCRVFRRPPASAAATSHGFTLIEILVVMVIISIMTGIVVANLPSLGFSREFETESRRLVTLLRMVREEAVLQGQEYGLVVEPDGYEFMIYDEFAQAWSPVSVNPFQARPLPEGIELLLEVEEQGLTLGGDREEESSVPRVLFLSSGEVTPFELAIVLSADDRINRLGTDGYRAIEWREEDDAP